MCRARNTPQRMVVLRGISIWACAFMPFGASQNQQKSSESIECTLRRYAICVGNHIILALYKKFAANLCIPTQNIDKICASCYSCAVAHLLGQKDVQLWQYLHL